MSEELHYKLRAYQDFQGMQKLLSQVSEIEVININYSSLKQDFLEIEEKIKSIIKITSIPNSKISVSANLQILEEWINSVMFQSELQSPIYLRLSDFYAAGWIQIKSNDLSRSLFLTCQLLTTKDLAIVDQKLSRLLVFSEEEYEIQAYWQ